MCYSRRWQEVKEVGEESAVVESMYCSEKKLAAEVVGDAEAPVEEGEIRTVLVTT